jgi:hypothetical protein
MSPRREGYRAARRVRYAALERGAWSVQLTLRAMYTRAAGVRRVIDTTYPTYRHARLPGRSSDRIAAATRPPDASALKHWEHWAGWASTTRPVKTASGAELYRRGNQRELVVGCSSACADEPRFATHPLSAPYAGQLLSCPMQAKPAHLDRWSWNFAPNDHHHPCRPTSGYGVLSADDPRLLVALCSTC